MPIVERAVSIKETVASMPRIRDDVVSVVEDLEGDPSSDEDELEATDNTEGVSFEEQKLTVSEVANDQNVKRNETVALLQSLTKEQILALLSQTETGRTIENPDLNSASGDEKRKKNDVDVSISIGKRSAIKSGIHNSSKRARKTRPAAKETASMPKMIVRNSNKSRR